MTMTQDRKLVGWDRTAGLSYGERIGQLDATQEAGSHIRQIGRCVIVGPGASAAAVIAFVKA